MYALLALGFTLVYGILELINFSHFNVFMVGSFVALWRAAGVRAVRSGQVILTGLPLVGVLLVALRRHHAVLRRARRRDRAALPAALAQREGAGAR